MTTLPKLYKKTSTGKIQEWEIYTAFSPDDEGAATIVTTYGLKDGKKQIAGEIVRYGKNLGKANATTPLEQAELEAKSQWEQKLKKGYVQSLEDAEAGKKDAIIKGGIGPMLAHSYDKQGHKIQFPVFVQPKLDGHRCIAIIQDGKCTLWSRTQKKIESMPHIVAALEKMYANVSWQPIILDGELYNHDYREKFEELTSKIRQSKPQPGHEVVQFWVYDMIVAGRNDTFEERQKELDGVSFRAGAEKVDNTIVALPTFEAANEDEMMTIQTAFIEQGYEGLMARNKTGRYKNGRSYDLQKVKTFQDAEFPVVAIEEGKGKMAGRAMFVCDAGNGETFRVKMVGALDDLKTYFDNPEPWIGKQLTVKFQKLSAKGTPIFPVAMRFRKDV